MNAREMFPGKYLKAADLQGKIHKVVIDGLEQKEVGEDKEKMWVLSFRGKDRGLCLNVTNTNMLIDLMGDDTDDWMGKEIQLGPEKTDFGGKKVDCIRVKDTRPVEEPVMAGEGDGDVPF